MSERVEGGAGIPAAEAGGRSPNDQHRNNAAQGSGALGLREGRLYESQVLEATLDRLIEERKKRRPPTQSEQDEMSGSGCRNSKRGSWRRGSATRSLSASSGAALKSEKIVAGPVVVDGDVVRLIKLPDGSGRIEVWKPGEGWTKAAAGMFTPDELMPGAARSVSARTAATLGIPASEL